MLHSTGTDDADQTPDDPASDVPGGIVAAADWRNAVTALLPSLRAFAWSLSRNGADADDLVQETLTKAWTHRERFEPGTNLRAWLFTILRNAWYTTAAKRRREVADAEGRHAARLTAEGNQEWSVELDDLRQALDALPPEHREAIVLVGAAGLSYEEAAQITGCAVGTIKSRVNRARNKLALALDVPRGHDDGQRPATTSSTSSTAASEVAQEQTNRTEPSSKR